MPIGVTILLCHLMKLKLLLEKALKLLSKLADDNAADLSVATE